MAANSNAALRWNGAVRNVSSTATHCGATMRSSAVVPITASDGEVKAQKLEGSISSFETERTEIKSLIRNFTGALLPRQATTSNGEWASSLDQRLPPSFC